MLRGLEPLHSLAAVIIIQHLMGLTMGVLGYALLRRYKLPGWGATLAMVPVLLSAYAIQMEHELLSDTSVRVPGPDRGRGDGVVARSAAVGLRCACVRAPTR
jgi:hypothetical protein